MMESVTENSAILKMTVDAAKISLCAKPLGPIIKKVSGILTVNPVEIKGKRKKPFTHFAWFPIISQYMTEL